MASDARHFKLPGIEDLTKEQEAVLAMPREGCHLVVGGPGTGKTVVCLLRARRLARRKNDYVFLVWNHLLHRASRALFEGQLQAETWQSWFGKMFWQIFRKEFSKLEPDASGWREIDWKAVTQAVEELPPPENGMPSRPSLVIDEGQDMPPQFYDFLLQVGFKNIFVAADQNQRITEENSSREELKNVLDLENEDVVELKKNHRNWLSVARLAKEFYTDDPAVSAPDLPFQRSGAATPRLHYMDGESMREVAERIVKHWDRDPRLLIGVIAPNNKVRGQYHDALKDAAQTVRLDNGRPRVVTFYGNHRPEVQFDRGGILVINVQACKGLEFDTDILAGIHEYFVNAGDPDQTKRRFYVMVSRARRRVEMFMRCGVRDEIEAILPKDESILRRGRFGEV